MCSICGMIDYEGGAELSENIVDKMSKTMTHRGPDDTGIIKTPFAVFAHNRLAVMDPQNGKQPMSAVVNGYRYTIIYNGEIYNFTELRQDLEQKGITFSTSGDTEVVLYTYIVYKERCPELLNGIFSFAIIDEKEQKVFLARDRFGVKPFFYCFVGSSLLIASEIKALLAHPKVTPCLDREGLWQLLFLSPSTVNGSGVFKDIHEIEPACAGCFDKDGLHINKYWSLTPCDINITTDEAAEETERILTDAISRQLVSDVPLAVLLSGGLDSSVVAALCVEALGKDRVIGVLMPNGEQHDIDCAYSLVNHLGIKHYVVNIKDAVDGLVGSMPADLPLSFQSTSNIMPRIRMTAVYAVSQSCNGRVANTCNLSEDYVGYATRYGDGAGDFSPISKLTVQEVKALGRVLGLPENLIEKTPIDGLSGKTDEENLGFTYAVLDRYIRTGVCEDEEIKAKIDKLYLANKFKLEPIPFFDPNI